MRKLEQPFNALVMGPVIIFMEMNMVDSRPFEARGYRARKNFLGKVKKRNIFQVI